MEEAAEFNIGIKALITNDKNEILLLKAGHEETKHTKIDFWDFPGGRIKQGYGIEDTLRREVEEELGIPGEDIKTESIFDATISNFKQLHGRLFLMLIVYKCRLLGSKKFKLSNEHSECKWLPIDEAKKLLGTKFPKSFTDKLDELKKGS